LYRMTNKSYNDFKSWKEFQEYFPEKAQIKPGQEPQEEYWNWKEYNVHIDRYIPENKVEKIKVILVHGGGANGRLMFPIGVVLRENGYECVSADLPGFGLTEVRKPNSYDTWIELIEALVEKERRIDDRKIVLCGISLGGMLSYHVACRSDGVSGIIVSALADTSRSEVQQQLAKNRLVAMLGLNLTNKMGTVLDGVKIPIRSTTKMWAMANNEEFVKKLERDKVGSGGKVYIKFLRTLFQAKPELEPELYKGPPLLFVQPDKDHILPWWVSEPFYNRLACPKQVVILEGCGHIPMEEPGITQLEEAALEFLKGIES
jgi:alpha-beta hydrolase superfamily lysophospholipase